MRFEKKCSSYFCVTKLIFFLDFWITFHFWIVKIFFVNFCFFLKFLVNTIFTKNWRAKFFTKNTTLLYVTCFSRNTIFKLFSSFRFFRCFFYVLNNRFLFLDFLNTFFFRFFEFLVNAIFTKNWRAKFFTKNTTLLYVTCFSRNTIFKLFLSVRFIRYYFLIFWIVLYIFGFFKYFFFIFGFFWILG